MLKILLSFLMILMVNPSYAVVDLFDQNRGAKPKPKVVKKKIVKKVPKKVVRKAKKLNLSLVGMFKSKATILYFKDMKNKSVRLRYNPDEKNSLPGYPELIIEKIDNRIVYVKDKDLIYCSDNEKKGIICQEQEGILEMSMAHKYVAAPRSSKTKSLNKKSFTNKRANNRTNSRTNSRTNKNNRRSNPRDKSNPFGRSSPKQ